MTPRQRTLRGLAVVFALAFAAGAVAIAVEFRAVAAGGNSTISEIVWSAWAAQPGAFVFVLASPLFGAGVLVGHLFWAPRVVYDAIREHVDLDSALRVALEVRSLLDEYPRAGPHTLTLAFYWGVGTKRVERDAAFLEDLARDTRATRA